MEEGTCIEGVVLGSNMTQQPFMYQDDESRDYLR